MTTSAAPLPMLLCDRPVKCFQVRSLQVQEAVNMEEPKVVLVSSPVEPLPAIDGTQRFCVNRKEKECFTLSRNPLAKTRENPRANVAAKLARQTTERR